MVEMVILTLRRLVNWSPFDLKEFREIIEKLVNTIRQVIQSAGTSSGQKFWGLYLLKEMAFSGRIELFEKIEEMLLPDLFILAQHEKKNKSMDRGRTIFKEMDPEAGRKAILR